jgi:hypothetical protein
LQIGPQRGPDETATDRSSQQIAKQSKIKYTIAEVTVTTGKMASITVGIDGQNVKIPVPSEVRAYFNEQFVRPNPTPAQRKRYGTLMNLLRAAYKTGKKAGVAE